MPFGSLTGKRVSKGDSLSAGGTYTCQSKPNCALICMIASLFSIPARRICCFRGVARVALKSKREGGTLWVYTSRT